MENWPGATVGAAYALTGVSFFIIISRNILRRLKHEDQLPDDYVMLASIALYAISTATNPVAYFNGTNVRVEHPRRLFPDEVQNATLGSMYVLIGSIFYVTWTWVAKACMLIFYTRIITENHVELIALKGTAILLGVTWLVSICTIFLECNPLEQYWQVLPGTPMCAKAIASTLVTGSMHIGTNVILMMLPIPSIVRAEFPARSILHVSILFTLNFFIIAVVIIRMVIISRSNAQWQAQNLIWRQVECFLMTVLINQPILYRIWRHGFNHIRKGKFGMDACSTGYCPPVENQNPRTESGRSGHKMSILRGNIRSSAQKLSEKARRSIGLQVGQIETTVELLQTRKTGIMNQDEGGPAEDHHDDAMFGGNSGRIAQISTTVERGGDHNILPEVERTSVLVADITTVQQAVKKFTNLKKSKSSSKQSPE